MFVDTSGRRSRLLRRIGLLVGVVCAGYAAVLVMAFMGWGTSLNPSSLLPFGDGQSSRQGPGFEPQGGIGGRVGTPSATPSSLPSTSSSSSPASSPSSSASLSGSSAGSSSATSTSSGDAS